MELTEFLDKRKNTILENAYVILKNHHLKSYDNSTSGENKERLQKLFDLSLESIKTKDLKHINTYSSELGEKRFHSGFDLSEVQTAFNALEEVIWNTIINEYELSEQGRALGLISTALGTGKQTLALTYVSLATKRKVTTLDLSELFD